MGKFTKSTNFKRNQNTKSIDYDELNLPADNSKKNPYYIDDTIRIIFDDINHKLHEKERKAYLMFYFSNIKYREIEEELEIKNAGIYIKRALKKIRINLEQIETE